MLGVPSRFTLYIWRYGSCGVSYGLTEKIQKRKRL